MTGGPSPVWSKAILVPSAENVVLIENLPKFRGVSCLDGNGGKTVRFYSDGWREPERSEYVGSYEPVDLDHQVPLQPKDINPDPPFLAFSIPPTLSPPP